MRVLVDYRSALRARTGAGMYVHELIRAYTQRHPDEITAFSSSWKDRVAPGTAEALGAQVVDRRVPVGTLNYLWHRHEWPAVETLAADADVVHSGHPLMMPSHRAAQVVTIHDLYFLSNPEQTGGEVRRDYPALVESHARRADAVITSSRYAKGLVMRAFGLPDEKVHVVRPGPPAWTAAHLNRSGPGAHMLFLGTLDPRKNLDVVLDAYERLADHGRALPPLVVAGGPGLASGRWLDRMTRGALRDAVSYRGYVTDDERERLMRTARALLLPSWDEGFGLPALEAMACGVPVIASNRGALPEVVDAAGIILDATDVEGWTLAIARLADDDDGAVALGAGGRARAQVFNWDVAADALHTAYLAAVESRRARR
jgi:glycosyltransferase involved in cell wall biosynthesis